MEDPKVKKYLALLLALVMVFTGSSRRHRSPRCGTRDPGRRARSRS